MDPPQPCHYQAKELIAAGKKRRLRRGKRRDDIALKSDAVCRDTLAVFCSLVLCSEGGGVGAAREDEGRQGCLTAAAAAASSLFLWGEGGSYQPQARRQGRRVATPAGGRAGSELWPADLPGMSFSPKPPPPAEDHPCNSVP